MENPDTKHPSDTSNPTLDPKAPHPPKSVPKADPKSQPSPEKTLKTCEEYFSSDLTKITTTKPSLSKSLQTPIKDISYNEYVVKDENLKFLCSPHIINLKQKETSFIHHDFKCEYLLLRYLTDDEIHKNKLVKFANQSNKLNRFLNVLPYEYNAVYINNDKKEQNYINASYILSPPSNINFILAQNPLESTINSFWLMIIKNEITFVAFFSYTFEESNDKYTNYWPKDAKTPMIIDNKYDGGNVNESKTYKIVFDSTNSIIEKYYTNRTFDVYDDKDQKILTINQFHVNCWEEHSIPLQHLQFQVIDDLIGRIDDEFKEKLKGKDKNKDCFALLHCSDGIGRSGTFIAIFNVIKCLMMQKKAKCNEPVFNVFNVVRKLREERYGMITDAVQYKYVYDFCKEWVKKYYSI